MSDIICDDYRLLQVISRFGLTFGFGDQTVATACTANGVDTMTFLAVVNFIKSNGRINVGDVVETISVAAMTKYLSQSHTYFVDFRIPAIRRKLIESIDCSARNQIAFLILKFYDEFAAEVSRHMEYEDKYIQDNGVDTPYYQTIRVEDYSEIAESTGEEEIQPDVVKKITVTIAYKSGNENKEISLSTSMSTET